MSILEVIKKHQIQAKKSLGQNFLIDPNIQKKIVAALGIETSDTVVEIGPGVGSLTQWILQSDAQKVILIEKDSSLIPFLQDLKNASACPTEIIEADALTISYKTLSETPIKLISNLPYNISTPLIIGWLKEAASFSKLVLMMQKEVAERLVAPPHTKTYGRLSVLVQWLCQAKILFHVPPTVFRPQPKVTSSVIELTPKKDLPSLADIEAMEKTTNLLFQKRRKMLKAILKGHVPDPISFLNALKIDPNARPENLCIHSFQKISNALFAPA